MANQIIDLRKTKEAIAANSDTPEEFAWSALEYHKRLRGRSWYLFLGAGALALIIFSIFSKSYFFAVFVGLAFAVMLMYDRKGPQQLTFLITPEGLQIDKKFHEFTDFKSFWVFEEDHIRELSLETKNALLPFLRLPLGEGDSAGLREILRRYIPEEKHFDGPADMIARGLGF